MSIPMNSTCYQCHLGRNLDTARSLGDEEKATAFARELMQLYLEAPEGVSSPWFGPAADQLFQKYYNVPRDRFAQEKEVSNRFALARLEKVQETVAAAKDPVYLALQFAVLGNYIDFSALQGEVSFEKLDALLEQAHKLDLDRDTYTQLCQELEKANKLLFLTDNAGEIVFDRVLAEQLQKKYPQLHITFCVRGGPAYNDATRADAEMVGIPFPVIDNGNCVGGTELSLLSEEARRAMEEADVILSKGQGNVETLLGCGYNIYYAFLIKCQRFVEHFGKPKLTPMLLREHNHGAPSK